jgi:hypothetical protein
MEQSFEDFMREFERKGKEYRTEMNIKKKKDLARKRLESGTPELPEIQGKIYDARNDEDREAALEKLKKVKNTISDIRQLKQYER